MIFGVKKNFIVIILAVLFFSMAFCAKAETLGENKKFFIEPSYDLLGRDNADSVLVKISDKAYFYADQSWWNFTDRTEAIKSINALADEFSYKIYPVLVSFYGSEWNSGIDNDSRITILIHPMSKESGGYFREKDEYSILQNSFSNQREMIYLNSDYLKSDLEKSLLAHDFTHLITFNQKNRIIGVKEDIWLNEGRADYSPTLLGYDSVYEGSNLQRRVRSFTEKPSESFIDWRNTKYSYAAVNLFIQYLVDNYGEDILVYSLKSNKSGIDSINYALKKKGVKEDFSQIFLNWTIAVYLNDCSASDKYCYKNPNLKNLQISSQINFLPLSGESTLSLADNLKNWTANWYKVIGGKETLKIKFQGDRAVFSKVPYIIKNRNGSYKVDFLTVGKDDTAEISVKNFGTDVIAFVIIPAVYKNNILDGLYYSFFWSASIVKDENNSDLINQLLAQIEYLKNEIAKLQGQNNGQNGGQNLSCASLNNNLYTGMKNSEVTCLQEFLKSQGAEVYPEGMVTGTFGQLTKNAVIRFQKKYLGAQYGTGFVGTLTRNKINSMI